jgi:hypothetical protein
VRALLGVALLLAFAGSAAAAASNGPLFRRADGSTIVFPRDVRAWCGRTHLNVATASPHIRRSHWELVISRKRIRRGAVIPFSWRHENGVAVFVYDAKTHNEASQGAEGSHGVVTLRRAGCRRGAALRIGLSGTIASEFSDGKPVTVSGTYSGTVGPAPR